MRQLNAQTVPLRGTNLIEASAGTGKTWTLSWLYLRLVISGLQVGQILVVTYTEAATAELRDRIRRRLADALAYLEGRACNEEYPSLLEEAECDLCCQRLQLALVSFDEAAVFTIHGFCKRVLSENAFEAYLPFEHELVTDEEDLLVELTDQFWYRHFLQPDALYLALLREYRLTPDSLLNSVRQFIGKPYLQEQIPALDASNFVEQQQAYQQNLQRCAQLWQEQQTEITALLHDAISNKVLNGTSYKLADLPKWCETLN
ncbi:MAG: UvrD-helicase domain-containing protein, partial [Thiothrix sp.]